MTAKLDLSGDLEIASIAEAAGQPDPEKRVYHRGVLYVEGVTQQALEDAAAAYDPLPGAKARKVTELNAACRAAIESGFTSTALGAEHFYPTASIEDQINLAANRTGWQKCRDASGVWDFRAHTEAQMEQVLADGSALKLHYLQKVNTLREQAANATSEAELDAITW